MNDPIKIEKPLRMPVAAVGRKSVGAALLIIGGVFLVLNFLGVALWPLFILGPGLALLAPAALLQPGQRPRAAYLAVPGAVMVALSALLFVQLLTGYWQSWAYAWPLLPIAAMVGLQYARRYEEGERILRNSNRVIKVLVWIMVAFALLFELIFFGRLGNWLPLLLMAGGAWLIWRSRRTGEKYG